MKKVAALLMTFSLMLVLYCTPVLAARADRYDPDKEVKVREVVINLPSATVRVNQQRTLWAYVVPTDAEDQVLYWSSSNPEVAKVYDDGIVEGISPGTATITATSGNGKTDTCIVTVPATATTGFMEDLQNGDQPESAVPSGEILTAAVLRLEVENAVKAASKGTTATVTYRDKTTVSTAAIRGAAFTADYNGGQVQLKFMTPGAGNGQPQGQIAINPKNASTQDFDIKVGVYTNSDRAQAIRENAKKTFGNNVAAVYMPHQGSFGMAVRVAAKVDLIGFDTQALKIYTYDSASDTYTLLRDQSYSVDSGYVFFNTEHGGAFVISDKQLK